LWIIEKNLVTLLEMDLPLLWSCKTLWTVCTAPNTVNSVLPELMLFPQLASRKGQQLVFATRKGANVWLEVPKYMSPIDITVLVTDKSIAIIENYNLLPIDTVLNSAQSMPTNFTSERNPFGDLVRCRWNA